ncbi:hypothetical protein BCR35DRAFT_349141 [Leucosporidium creatinivorum]|uniref:Reverse transcriptase zinc-binding domain-containing protein n=1 Tax=Leucosporidium creatinivorum TaxID=106004 RepID=A0A1Y2G4F0_9BASI|nr:hypothetical protein BCR35DRAFT_349141 [Leucosporidium creatinivorum]
MADDIAALALGPPKKKGGKRNSTAANAVMQKRLMEIGHWCSRNLLSISIAKTVWMVIYFSKLSEEESAEAAELSLSLHGKPLAEAPSAKYIGLLYTKFDTTRYRHHMTKLAGSLRGHSNTLINVQGQHGALSPRDSRDFYVEQARSLVLFSAPITFAADGKMLESAEHDYMRAILRLGAASSVEAMYLELDLQPITSVRWGLAIQFFYYASSAEAPTLVRAALRDNMSLESKANAMLPSWFAHLVGVAAVCGIEIARWLPENGIERKDLPSPAETKGIVRRWQRGALEAKMSKARAFFLRPILSPKIRDYLQILSFEERFHFTRMRMGFTYLQIELGRWQTVKPSSKERTCRMCPLSITEDVPHVLGGCGNEKLHKLRMEFMAQLLSLPKAEFYAAFADWSSPVLWWLLLNETEPQVLRCVAKYGKTALSLVYTYPLTL